MTPPWFDKVSGLIEDIANLKDGWASSDGKAIDRAAIDMALRVFRDLPSDTPSPHPFPTLDGGVVLEWYMRPRFLGVRFLSADTIEVYVYNGATFTARTESVTGDREIVAAVQSLVAELVER